MTNDNLTASSVMRSIIPITRFNRGEANKIFDEVAEDGFKIVVKNNKPACVLLTPERYDEMMEMISDSILYDEAERRMNDVKATDNKTRGEFLSDLGISDENLANVEVNIDE